VTINEALEIAKRYSTSGSAAFINGILDKIARGAKSQRKKA
jgi:N utilization substance protein B